MYYKKKDYVIKRDNGKMELKEEMGVIGLKVKVLIIGLLMEMGKEEVLKNIKVYYKGNVGDVGGIVGMIGGIGGLIMKIMLGVMMEKKGMWKRWLMMILVIVVV